VYALVVAGTAALVGFTLFFAAQGKFGGADSKALICIGLSLPLSPHMLIVPFFGFVVAALLVGVAYIIHKGKRQTVRLIPYLTAGVILTCTVPYMYIF
jgi:Flp pilus assembly protein protease CpaA